MVLMYHSVGENGAPEVGARLYTLPVEKFIKQMSLIYEMIKAPVDHNPITLTFDDGLLNNYRVAYPILKDVGLTAYFFIMPTRVGTPGYMNWDKIIELHCNGMVIGSHGMTHTILTQLDEEEMEYEIAASKRKLEEKLDDEVDCFSVPRGFYNKKVIQKLIDAGYKKVFTSNPEDNDGYRFGRIAVRASWDMKYFQRVIERGLPFQAKAWENVKGGVARAIGPGMYDKIRKNILKGSKGKEK